MATLVKPKKEKTRKAKSQPAIAHQESNVQPEEEDTDNKYKELSTGEQSQAENASLLEELERAAAVMSVSGMATKITSHDCCISSDVNNANTALEAEAEVEPTAPPLQPIPVAAQLVQYPNLAPMRLSNAPNEERVSPVVYQQPRQLQSPGFALIRSQLKPMTSAELKEIYDPELELVEQFELEFLMNSLLESSETDALYMALMEYYNLQHKLSSNLHDVQKCRKLCLDTQQVVWQRQEVTRRFSGTCGDGNTVYESITYDCIKLDPIRMEAANAALTALHDLVCHTYITNHISAKTSKVKIDQLINQLLATPAHSIDADARIALHSQLDAETLHCVSQLRRAIAILFGFIRKPSPNNQFDAELKKWLRQLVALQLLLATKEDHWFLLFNILRCPSGVGGWSAELLQLPGMCSAAKAQSNELPLPLQAPEIKHCLAVLQILLLPIKQRNEYLKSYAQAHRELTDAAGAAERWTVVDSDGEDTYTATGDCVGLKESDLIALLNQLPFEQLFRAALQIEKFLNDYIIEPDMITPQRMLSVVSFFSQLVQTIGEGMLTYNNERYKQLAKRLGRLVRHTLQYVFDYHALFMHNSLNKSLASCERIEVELCALLIRACSYIYRTRNLATWQYFATLPYAALNAEAIWHIFYYLNVGFPTELSDAQLATDAIAAYKADNFWMKFNVANADVAPEDMYYLLQAFFEMANSREPAKDWELIKAICLHIFQIGFINNHTRDVCYKTARDMLVNITLVHAELMSCLLLQLKIRFAELEQASYLFKSLPLENWQPGMESFEILSNWLLHFDYKSGENIMARTIISHLNWGFDEEGRLFLPHNIHVRMACLIAEAATKHAPELIGQSGVSESVRGQVSTLMDTGQTHQQQFISWCWTMVSMLRLHLMDQSVAAVRRTLQNPTEQLLYVPELERIDMIYQGVSEHRPLALYVGMLVSQHGHAIPVICQHGFALLQRLLQDHRHAAVIRCLELILPLFLETPETLANCESFQKLLLTLLNADKTYLKLAKDMVYANLVGPVLQLLDDMLHHQIIAYTSFGLYSPLNLMNVWLNCFTALPGWAQHTHVLYLLDKMLRIAYQFPDCRVQATEFFYNYYKDCSSAWKTNAKSSAFKALFAVQPVSRIPLIAPEHCWLSLVLLELEFRLQDVSFWHELLRQLASSDNSLQLDAALKKTLSITQTAAFPANMLVIYKYATLIAAMEVNHALFPIINQRFFELYLWRVPAEYQTHVSGVADKFYGHNVSLMKSLKSQLKSAESYHENLAIKHAADEAASYFHRSCHKLMQSYALWLEDTSINTFESDVSQVPVQYNNEKLRELLSGNVTHWTEYLFPSAIRKQQRHQSDRWAGKCYRLQLPTQLRSPLQVAPQTTTPSQRIKRHLSSYEQQLPAPAHSHAAAPTTCALSGKTLKQLQRQLQLLNSTANMCHYKSAELNSLNLNYVDRLPALYTMVPYTETRSKECDSLLFKRKCCRPAMIELQPAHIRRNEENARTMSNNRERHDTLLDELLHLHVDSFAAASVHLGDYIRQLLQAPHMDELASSIGIEFFYQLVDNMTDINMQFQPSCKLYTHVMQELGIFIQNNQDAQGLRILQLAMQRGDLLEVLAGVFVPGRTSVTHFLEMYKFLIDSHLRRCDAKILFVLLSKFDLVSWLAACQPKPSELNQLLLLVLQGLEAWSQPDSSLLQDQFRRQLVHIFGYEFPQHYSEVLQLVLDRTAEQKLQPLVLLDLLNWLLASGSGNTTALSLDSNSMQLNAAALDFAHHQQLFTLKSTTDTLLLLARHFQQERLHHGLHGLYPRHKHYCQPLAMWFTCFGHVLLAAAICSYHDMLADQISDIVFDALAELYAPWLIAYTPQTIAQPANWIRQLTAEGKMLLPWSEPNVSLCTLLIRRFMDIMLYVLEQLPGSQRVLEHLFAWYVQHFALPNMPSYVLAPIHEGLTLLPWERFRPQTKHVHMLYDCLQCPLPESHAMLGHIFMRIDWNSWLATRVPQQPALVSRLFVIFVRFAFEPNIHIHPNTSKILEDANGFSWHLIEYVELEQLLKWFVAHVDPIIVLKLPTESNYADRAVLELLRLGSGMFAACNAAQPISQLMAKRMIYTRFSIRLQRVCGAKHSALLATKAGKLAFTAAFVELLNYIDAAIGTAIDGTHTREEQRREALNLMIEIVAPTQTQSEEISNLHIDTLVKWQQQCAPANAVMCSALYAIGHLNSYIACIYTLLESSIECYFRTSEQCSGYHSPSWQQLLQGIQMSLPKLELMPVMKGHNFFSLHVFVLYKLQELQNPGDKVTFLQDLIQLVNNLETNPHTEPRLALVWGLIISRGCQLLTGAMHIKKPLYMLARDLQLAATKAGGWSDGLLGAIGLKSEVITNRRRVLTRCLACIIFSLFPANRDLRVPSEEYESAKRELSMLLANKKFNDVKQLIVKAVSMLNEYPMPELRTVPHLVCRLIDVFYEQSYLTTIPEVWDFDFTL